MTGSGLFEEVAAEAARNYLGGDRNGARAYKFGFPRRLKPSGFVAALDDLCAQMGEGSGSKAKPARARQKDAKLDIVAWVPMPDRRTSKIFGFGQCATGRNWHSKVSEMQSEPWCRKWLIDQPPVSPLRMFFVPHRIDGAEWDDHAHDAGIIFDRCRLAAYASALPVDLRGQVVAWSRHVLTERLGR